MELEKMVINENFKESVRIKKGISELKREKSVTRQSLTHDLLGTQETITASKSQYPFRTTLTFTQPHPQLINPTQLSISPIA